MQERDLSGLSSKKLLFCTRTPSPHFLKIFYKALHLRESTFSLTGSKGFFYFSNNYIPSLDSLGSMLTAIAKSLHA